MPASIPALQTSISCFAVLKQMQQRTHVFKMQDPPESCVPPSVYSPAIARKYLFQEASLRIHKLSTENRVAQVCVFLSS